MKRLLARLALVCFSLLLALGLAEVALRVLPLPDLRVLAAGQAPRASAWKDPGWGDPPDRAFQRHRVLGNEHAPNVDVAVPLVEHQRGSFRFRTNNLGLRRDARTATEKPGEAFRVLVLGDSQTDGYVDNGENFATLLEDELRDRTGGRRIEVLNGGVAGYSTAQEYLWFDVNGRELKPDLVVLVFYPGNDALDLLDPFKPNVDPATGRAVRPREESPESSGPLDESRLGILARYAVQVGPLAETWRRFNLPGRLTEAGGYSTETLVEVFKACHGCYLQSLQQAARAKREPGAVRAAAGQAGAILARLDEDVRANGGRLAVAILPTRAQVEPDLARPLHRQVAGLLGLTEADLAAEDAVARVVQERLAGAGVPTLGLREPLRAASGAEGLYYSRDWHLNARGHQIVAGVLARGLGELGLLPGR